MKRFAKSSSSIFCFILPLLLCVSATSAVGSEDNYYFVDQLIDIDFSVDSVVVVVLSGGQAIETYPAVAREELGIVGAVIPAHAAVSTVFLIFGKKADAFKASDVRYWSAEDLKENTLSAEQVRLSIAAINQSIEAENQRLEIIRGHFNELREKASLVAGVEHVLEKQVELARLERDIRRLDQEKERLTSLVEHGRSLNDPEAVLEWRKSLSIDLRETAQATAMADRLNARRKQAAVNALQSKLALIRETQGEDASALAREVLRLRNQRRDLEGRLGISGELYPEDF